MKNGKTRVKIYNLSTDKLHDKRRLENFVRDILKVEKCDNLTLVNIIIADASYLKELNKKFFKRNKTTNVISFNLGDIGEIYISKDQVIVPEDLYYYLAHGLLHILGYDHKTKKTDGLMDKKCKGHINRFFSI